MTPGEGEAIVTRMGAGGGAGAGAAAAGLLGAPALGGAGGGAAAPLGGAVDVPAGGAAAGLVQPPSSTDSRSAQTASQPIDRVSTPVLLGVITFDPHDRLRVPAPLSG